MSSLLYVVLYHVTNYVSTGFSKPVLPHADPVVFFILLLLRACFLLLLHKIPHADDLGGECVVRLAVEQVVRRVGADLFPNNGDAPLLVTLLDALLATNTDLLVASVFILLCVNAVVAFLVKTVLFLIYPRWYEKAI